MNTTYPRIEIGIGLIVLGLLIYFLGVFLFLDRAMLAIGNVRIAKSYIMRIDLILNGSCGTRWTKERLRFLYEGVKN